MKRLFLLLFAAGFASLAGAADGGGFSFGKSNDGEFLEPDQAFRLIATAQGPDRIALDWQVTPGYYLYKSRIKAVTTSDRAQLGTVTLPKGEEKEDEYFGKQEVYHHDVSATVAVSRGAAGETLTLPLKVTYQGCADKGLCYPPITKTFDVSLPPGVGSASSSVGAATDTNAYVSEQDQKASFIRDGNLLLVMGVFLLSGIGLAFTPCVLPMIPILSGIVIGQGDKVTRGRSFVLSLVYVLGMSFTYTLAGALFAAAGKQVQAIFQQPWVIGTFAGMFVILAISMFGAFTLQMPAAIQTRLSNVSNRQTSGTFIGVAIMGALSALIVTTCVGPALVAALAVISETGDVVRGAAALFAMSIGMGIPLLLVGASAGELLPRAGAWMDMVKKLIGAMMLGVAAWMLERIVPARVAMILWAIPLIIAAVVLWQATARTRRTILITRAIGVVSALYGLTIVAGAALGGTDPLSPLARATHGSEQELAFRTIKSVDDLQREVSAAKANSQPVLLDFYADWCVSCKEMEKYTFSDAKVQASLKKALLLRADVTKNDEQDQALLKHFGIFGPPTIAFYGANGEERRNYRVVGYMKAPEFASLSQQAMN
jgi:thiol:disulfide interchange protein DsbD